MNVSWLIVFPLTLTVVLAAVCCAPSQPTANPTTTTSPIVNSTIQKSSALAKPDVSNESPQQTYYIVRQQRYVGSLHINVVVHVPIDPDQRVNVLLHVRNSGVDAVTLSHPPIISVGLRDIVKWLDWQEQKYEGEPRRLPVMSASTMFTATRYRWEPINIPPDVGRLFETSVDRPVYKLKNLPPFDPEEDVHISLSLVGQPEKVLINVPIPVVQGSRN
jgi:hypothetical protein